MFEILNGPPSASGAGPSTEQVPTEPPSYFPVPDLPTRLAALRGARNPFLAAAGPLLRAMADMPAELDVTGLRALRGLLESEVKAFSLLCDQANLRREHVLATRYALCTALDEAASLKPWGGGTAINTGPWSEHALLQTFHQEGNGGKKVFLLIGRLAANPEEHLPVLEVMYHILGLGFEGHYRTQTDGHRMVETIRNRLFALLAGVRESVARELSPHWQSAEKGQFKLLRGVPVWMSVGVLGLALLALFAWDKYHLVMEAQLVENRIRDIGKLMPAPRQLRLAELLANEIAAGRVGVEENGLHSKVTFRGDDMFSPGQPVVNARVLPMLDKVAAGINEVQGSVEVIGHTDNMPIATRAFPNNQVLSESRARAVAQALIDRHVDVGRVTTSGQGDAQPKADNGTVAGRAQNRRVEIVVNAQ